MLKLLKTRLRVPFHDDTLNDHLSIWVNLTDEQHSRINGLDEDILKVIVDRFRLAHAQGVVVTNPHGNSHVCNFAA